MRRIDHAGIYLLIAGSYTPVGLLSLHGTLQHVTLAIVWAGVAALPEVWDTTGIAAVVLLAVGGVAYSAGAIVYAIQRPDPFPRVFGYHEVFHALTLVAVACQYVAIAFFVVKVA